MVNRYEEICPLDFSVLVDMSSLSVDMKMCQMCINQNEHCVGLYEEFSLLSFLCQSTWAVRWSTWRLIKICFSLFYLLFYFRHVFNKCTYLKHFKHTIKYNMSLLNILESSKSSKVNNLLLFDDDKTLELTINNLCILFINQASNWYHNHKLQVCRVCMMLWALQFMITWEWT